MRDLLQESKEMLNLPLVQSRRLYLIIFNLANAALTISFIVSLKIVSGKYVEAQPLIYLYIASIVVSLVTAVFNIIKRNSQKDNYLGKLALRASPIINNKGVDDTLSWSSVLLILSMSFFGILGYGTSVNAALFTNFSFAHSMIIASVLIIGRVPAVIWGCIVLVILVIDVNKVGWNQQLSPQTPTEAKQYQEGLARGESWALDRKAELDAHYLGTIDAARYARLWIIFIIISIGIAIAFGGVVNKIYQVVPSVINNIERSIQNNTRIKVELEHKKSEAAKAALRIARQTRDVERIEQELEKLEFSDTKKFMPILRIMREWKKEEDEVSWPAFIVNFDIIHPGFWEYINKNYAYLSLKELKHLAYLKMDLPSEEIAFLLGVTVDSLKSMRHRLKKKLQLSEKIDLREFVSSI